MIKVIKSYIKPFLPRSLFSRFTLIIAVPIILMQIIVSYIFYNRHWQNVSSYMMRTLSSEIRALISVYENNNYTENEDFRILSQSLLFSVLIKDKAMSESNKADQDELLSELIYHFSVDIKKPFIVKYVDKEKSNIIIEIKHQSKILEITFSKKRVDNPTTYIFILWLTGTNTIFLVIILMFSKNQIRPIIRLAQAADRFGKGLDVGNLKPEGSTEVRKAIISFLDMKRRLERYLEQRTLMLAGISHDLKTPLTRLRLEVALQNNKKLKPLLKDISEMEQMINSYLLFVKESKDGYDKGVFDLLELLNEKAQIFSGNNFKINIESFNAKTIKLLANRLEIGRAISNFFENSKRYATETLVIVKSYKDHHIIIIEDNGPGIDRKLRDKIFHPFFRLDHSRHLESANVGLGTTIAKDIITKHGGSVFIEDPQKLGGLRILIKLYKE